MEIAFFFFFFFYSFILYAKFCIEKYSVLIFPILQNTE